MQLRRAALDSSSGLHALVAKLAGEPQAKRPAIAHREFTAIPCPLMSPNWFPPDGRHNTTRS